jgi:hypothetical protein
MARNRRVRGQEGLEESGSETLHRHVGAAVERDFGGDGRGMPRAQPGPGTSAATDDAWREHPVWVRVTPVEEGFDLGRVGVAAHA